MARAPKHKWEFRARFRRGTFGWKSSPAVKRVKEAVAEIKRVARKDPALAAEGAVLLLERLSPALEGVDSSSGALGSAVNAAITVLVPIIAEAPADEGRRDDWLERLFEALTNDKIPYIENLTEYWGTLCAGPEPASRWADRLLGTTRAALGLDGAKRGFFHGTTACLSALFAAGRHRELLDLLKSEAFWPYQSWAVKALAAQGDRSAAIQKAESARGPWASDLDIDRLCEEILLSSGLTDEAYRGYGVRANWAGTYVAWFRAVAKKYPGKEAAEVLRDLVAATPDEEGKWFAAAKTAKLFDEAAALALRSPCSPQTLTRAARDFAEKNPRFAIQAGLAALHWLVEGYGYNITNLDVENAYTHTMDAARNAGCADDVHQKIRDVVRKETFGERFVTKFLGRRLDLR